MFESLFTLNNSRKTERCEGPIRYQRASIELQIIELQSATCRAAACLAISLVAPLPSFVGRQALRTVINVGVRRGGRSSKWLGLLD